ncbi:hypothetical protein ACEPAF_6703 [Sanghuangporus sanghuang]
METVLATVAPDGRTKIIIERTEQDRSDPVIVKARKLLVNDPEQFIENVKNGCLVSCEAVIYAVLTNDLPASIYSKTLEVLTTHIRNSCPLDKADERQFHLADASFSATCAAFALRLPYFKEPPLGPILQTWPSILTWANALYIRNAFPYKRRQRVSTFKILGEEELSMLLRGIQRLFESSSELKRIAFDPLVLELAMHVFLRGLTEYSRGICITYFLRYLGVTNGRSRVLDVILSQAEGKPEVFLDPILGRLTRDDTLAPLCATIIVCIASVRDHPLSLALETRGVDPISKLFETFASTENRSATFILCFHECIRYSSFYWKPWDGRDWLLRALRIRFFHFIAEYDELKSEPFIRDLLNLHLPVHLVDPSVIFACEEALSSVSPQEHSRIMSSDLKPTWMTFINRFFEQYLFYCYFEVAGYRKGCYKCSKVPDSKKGSLLSCGACRIVEYCSKECQTSGWKDHKTECKTLKGKKYGPLPQWAAPIFRRRIAAHDARRHFIGFRELAGQKCPILPFQSVCVIIDYSFYPPQLNVCPANEIKVEDTSSERGVDSSSSIQEECFDNFRLHDSSCGTLLTREYIDGTRSVHTQHFHWAPPYFCSPFGAHCPDAHKRKSLVTPYLAVNDETSNKKEKERKTAWSVVDELAFRTGLTTQMILEGKIGDFRRKVLEVVVREKATMRERSKIK